MGPDLRIRLARERADFDTCVLLQKAVWGLADLEVTSALQLVAGTHSGGILQLAEAEDGTALGFAYAFPALRGGVAHLHSDMLAVLPEHQQKGVGVRLKWAQRDEAMARGVALVTWTFDPLQARNANLNLRRLGAVAAEFVPNFYVSDGDPPRTVPTPAAPRINDVKWQAGWPVSSEPRMELDQPELLLEIPPEWDVLCQAAPRMAADWQSKVGRALQGYLGRGYVAADFAPTEEGGRRRPLYLLRKA
jgi:predicted GNAT superfamily acetyltransferase